MSALKEHENAGDWTNIGVKWKNAADWSIERTHGRMQGIGTTEEMRIGRDVAEFREERTMRRVEACTTHCHDLRVVVNP